MTRTTQRQDAESYFQDRCQNLGVDPDDLIHPGDVDHTDAEHLIGCRVLHFESSPDGMRRVDFTVDDIQEVPTGRGEEMFAVYYYRGDAPNGMNIEATRGELDSWESLHVRFVPEGAVSIPSARDAVELLRELPSHGDLRPPYAQELAEALGGEVTDDDFYEGKLSVPIFLSKMVSQVTDEGPYSGDDYFGRSITGHKKRDRGRYKANLTVLEDHFGLPETYSRSE